MSYINIHTEWLKEWGLPPSEAVVYGYLHGWLVDRRDKSVPFRQTQAQMAKEIGIDESTFKRTLKRLVALGYVEVKRQGTATTYHIHARMINNSESGKMPPSSKMPLDSGKMPPAEGQNATDISGKMPPTTIINHKLNTSSKQDVDDKDVPAPANNIKSMEVAEVSRLASEIRTEIQVGGEFANSAERLYGFDKNTLLDQLQFFQDHLTCAGTTHKTRGDFRAHFNNWLRKQYEKQYKQQQHGQRQQQNGPTEDYLRRIAAEVAANGGLAF